MGKDKKRKKNQGVKPNGVGASSQTLQMAALLSQACNFTSRRIAEAAIGWLKEQSQKDEFQALDVRQRVAGSIAWGVRSWVGIPDVSPLRRIIAIKGDLVKLTGLGSAVTVGMEDWEVGCGKREDGTWFIRLECPLKFTVEEDRPSDRLVMAKG